MKFAFEQIPKDTLGGELYTFESTTTYTFEFIENELTISEISTTHTKERTLIRPKKPTY